MTAFSQRRMAKALSPKLLYNLHVKFLCFLRKVQKRFEVFPFKLVMHEILFDIHVIHVIHVLSIS